MTDTPDNWTKHGKQTMDNKNQTINDAAFKSFVILTERMRAAQKDYFKGREDYYLKLAKQLEKQVDQAVKDYHQPSLFDAIADIARPNYSEGIDLIKQAIKSATVSVTASSENEKLVFEAKHNLGEIINSGISVEEVGDIINEANTPDIPLVGVHEANEGTSILDHFNTVKDDDLRGKLIANISRIESYGDYETSDKTLAHAIFHGFIWNKTPEGDPYWQKIYDKLVFDNQEQI